ncbi:adenosine kinase [Actinopolymorpha cephalotaxi]|uniref:Adenosine kinase n=1 Tax=Actinopolymorpha cephalotaxi TaxID=504797 RepID=A0A1I2QNT3_9ACTN|nr:carbohydrate kinase family protein [Actinopolymorpha cephalotaxi]NYH82588.1 adenosine kinase [Actinopolymorpha cephalotaxi]SFG28969.1 adenosine kinase [Actinopolymorpha cephalotaxi]
MPIAVTGSIATDHLMTFGGKFRDSLVVDQLDKISVSFLADDLEVRRGGVAANIAFGMACLGLDPVLVGAVGHDFADYRSWLERHGVDCGSVHTSDEHHTARFVCTTDSSHAQIATFYPGAMSEARKIELAPVADRVGGLDLVVVGANDPEAMRRHTDECRDRGYAFAADPSQQLAWSDGELIRELIDGATYFLSNEYESALTEQKTGWNTEEILTRVGVVVTTLGSEGVRIHRKGEAPIHVGVAPVRGLVDPTGVGDGFRAGFLASVGWGLDLERAAQVGCLLAAHVIETVGPQEYHLTRETFLGRLAEAYGDDAAADVEPMLTRVQEKITGS